MVTVEGVCGEREREREMQERGRETTDRRGCSLSLSLSLCLSVGPVTVASGPGSPRVAGDNSKKLRPPKIRARGVKGPTVETKRERRWATRRMEKDSVCWDVTYLAECGAEVGDGVAKWE